MRESRGIITSGWGRGGPELKLVRSDGSRVAACPFPYLLTIDRR